ncbi:MAG: RDD family protein [Actinobacteria bacterium]|nr:RDD family protein [Actinomycetota bacterium]
MSDPDREPGVPASITVTHLSHAQRDMLWMRLRGDDVPFDVTGETVSVPERCADRLNDALRWVAEDLAPMPITYDPPRPFQREDSEGNVVASRWMRLFGWWLDSLIVSVSYAAASGLDVSAWIAFAAVGVYFVCTTHWFGGTLGKLVVGIEVVDAEHPGARVGWGRSAIRWGATVLVAALAALLGSGRGAEILLAVSTLAIYSPILWDQRSQGLHDRLARTVVLRRQQRPRGH